MHVKDTGEMSPCLSATKRRERCKEGTHGWENQGARGGQDYEIPALDSVKGLRNIKEKVCEEKVT